MAAKARRKYTFLQRLFRYVLGLFLIFAVCFFFFQYQREKTFAADKLDGLLDNYNEYLHERVLRKGFSAAVIEDFMVDCPQKDLRITILDSLGNVVYDSEHQGASLENHSGREEVVAAKLHGRGFAIRQSATTNKKYFYSARNFGDYTYRSALPYGKYAESMLAVDKTFIYFMLVMAALIIAVLYRYTRNLGKIVTKLRLFADNAERGLPPDMREDEFPDDDLGDISRHIISLYRKLRRAKDESSDQRDKIVKHFQYSVEGYAMFGADGSEILSNNFFLQYANVISPVPLLSAGEIFSIEQFGPLKSFVASNSRTMHLNEKIPRERIIVSQGGKTFQVECIVFKDSTYEISINDITAQEHQHRLKKHLTQNVAHELKTPLSSIRGFLESVIDNPAITPEKRDIFLRRCYAQTERLSLLLKDISLLNSIDEAQDMFDIKPVDIGALVSEIVADSADAIEQKQMKVTVNLPENCIVYGNGSLLYSIFRNLLDNAISYSGDSTSVRIDCYREDSQYYYFIFADNGAGVGEEHINRIFDRFYRVDTGRSRKAGGTGLGLAIVKNAVIFHNGSISAKSAAGGGVEFLFTLKKRN